MSIADYITLALAVADAILAGAYLYVSDPWRATYWLCAGILTFSTIFME